MNEILAFALGAAVRFFVANASRNNARLEATIVGLWEGVALYHLTSAKKSSLTPYIGAAARFYVDLFIFQDLTKLFVTLLWGVVTRLACEALSNGHSHERKSASTRGNYRRRRSSVAGHVNDLLERQSRHHRQLSSSSSSSSSSNSTITHTSTAQHLPSERSPITTPTTNTIITSPSSDPTLSRSPQTSTESVRSIPQLAPVPSQIAFPTFQYLSSSSPINSPRDEVPELASTAGSTLVELQPARPPQQLRIQIPSTTPVEEEGQAPSYHAPVATPILPTRVTPEPENAPEAEQIQPVPPVSVVIADETDHPVDQSLLKVGSPLVILSKQDEPPSPAVSQFHHTNRAGSDDTLRTYSEHSFVSSGLGSGGTEESVISITGKEALLNRAEIYRTQARDEFEKASRLKRERNRALRRQDTKKAFLLYLEMKKCNETINSLNSKAARRIFMAHNQSHPDDTIDVHGLQREEAKLKTEQAIDALIRAGRSRLNVIVGKGLHSANGVPVLKRTIIEYLNEEYSQFGVQENPRNAGVLVVTFQV